MDNLTTPVLTKTRMLGIVLMFFGVQALFVIGSYYVPRTIVATGGMTGAEWFRTTFWLVVAANILVLGGGYIAFLLEERKKRRVI